MADLDDFFAKKDKKKGKAKKFVTAEEIAKQLDDTSKKAVESKMKKPTEPAEGGNTEPKQPDDEWMEVKEQKKDYSGLKLAQLNIDDESNQNNDSDNPNDINDPNYDADAAGEDRDPTKPWNKLDATAAARAKVPTVVEPTVATSNVYVSPALKNLRAKQKKGAPDLKSEEYFPTLGLEKPEPPKLPKKDPTFEDVKHGGRVKVVEQTTSGHVSVGNRFTSLSNDAS